MDKLIISFEKENPYEIIDKGDLVEINIETNKYRKCQNELSPFVVGICSDEWITPEDDRIPYNVFEDNDYQITTDKQEPNVNVQVAGIATVKTNGIVCVGDLLISSEDGKVEAVKYKNDWKYLGKIVGKCIQMTENEDECIMLISIN